jgi:signal peptidase II
MDPASRASLSSAWRWFALAAAVIVADQLTKAAVLARFAPGEALGVTPFFNLVLAFNRGVAFSFLLDAPAWLLIAFAVVAAGIVSVLLVRSPGKRLLCTALALILGGALGNVVDRVRLGRVVDFLDFTLAGWHWPAFNLADSAISIGAVLLILDGFLGREKRPQAPP